MYQCIFSVCRSIYCNFCIVGKISSSQNIMIVSFYFFIKTTARISIPDNMISVQAATFGKMSFHKRRSHQKQFIILIYLPIYNILFSNSLIQYTRFHIFFNCLTTYSMPQIEHGNTVKIFLENFFSLIYYIYACFPSYSFSLL